MKGIFTANRVVLILHGIFVVATAVAIFVAAIDNSLPHTVQGSVMVGVGILTAVASATVAVTKFLTGSQQWDLLHANDPAPAPPAPVVEPPAPAPIAPPAPAPAPAPVPAPLPAGGAGGVTATPGGLINGPGA